MSGDHNGTINENADEFSENNYEKAKSALRDLSEKERRELLEEVEIEEGYPLLTWAPNPTAVKATFNFISKQKAVTYEELRKYLVEAGYVETEEGKYNFGIISTDEDSLLFHTTGKKQPDTEISLTEIGRNVAAVFDDQDDLRPVEKALLFGLQPYGSGMNYLSILDSHRDDGILREDLKEKLTDTYGGSGSYFTGYYTSWFSKLGLIEKERIGRKKKFHPAFPQEW